MEILGGSFLVFNAGVMGVSFFFVLSGFILTYNYSDLFRGDVSVSDYKRFVWDRLARISPVHLLAMVLVMPVAFLSPNLPLDWRAVPVHLLLLQCWWPSLTSAFMDYLNVPSWSISCEWFFYVLAPMTIWLVIADRRRWVPVIGVLCYACGLGWLLWHSQSDSARLHFVSWFAPSRFVEFLAGVLLARMVLASSSYKPAAVSGVLQAIGILLIVAGAMYRQYAAWPLWGGLLYVPGSAFLILGLAYGRGIFVTHLSRPWLNRLGVASFSLYMIHAPLIRAVKGVCLYLGWEVRSWPEFWAVVFVMLVFVQITALAVCYGYELPLQKRLRTFFQG